MPDDLAEREPESLARHWYAAGEHARADAILAANLRRFEEGREFAWLCWEYENVARIERLIPAPAG